MHRKHFIFLATTLNADNALARVHLHLKRACLCTSAAFSGSVLRTCICREAGVRAYKGSLSRRCQHQNRLNRKTRGGWRDMSRKRPEVLHLSSTLSIQQSQRPTRSCVRVRRYNDGKWHWYAFHRAWSRRLPRNICIELVTSNTLFLKQTVYALSSN